MMLPQSLRTFKLALCTLALVGSATSQQFVDVAGPSGFNVPGSANITLGRGAAVGDFNGDGLTDLIVPGAPGQPFKAYLNIGGMNFVDIAPTANLGMCGDMKGFAIADYDNDGDLDIFSCVRNGPNRLYRNIGMMVFEEVGGPMGVDFTDSSLVATWGDYDNDGDTDLYVGVRKMPDAPGCNRLFRNDGTFFTETTMAAGVDHGSMTFATMFIDYDHDGWQDLWVTSDQAFVPSFRPNALYRNNGNGTFTDVSLAMGVQRGMQGMGVDATDINNDGRMAVFMSNTSIAMGNMMGNPTTDGHAMYHWNPLLEQFLAVETFYGVRMDDIGWANFFIDYDNDGRDDLFVKHMGSESALVRNLPTAPWTRLTPAASGFTTIDPDVAAGVGDFDNDGLMDIVEPRVSGPSKLMRNTGGNSNHYLTIALRGQASNRLGLGAEVRVLTAGDGVIRTRYMKSGNGMMVANEPIVHVGLGSSTSAALIQIKWPSGQLQNVTNVAADQRILITEPTLLLAEAMPGGNRPWTLDISSDVALPYVIGVSSATNPGISLSDGRVIPLAYDAVLELSLALNSPFSPQNVGSLDAIGCKNGQFIFPQTPLLNGVTLWTSAVTIDPSSPAWVRNIVGPFAIHF